MTGRPVSEDEQSGHHEEYGQQVPPPYEGQRYRGRAVAPQPVAPQPVAPPPPYAAPPHAAPPGAPQRVRLGIPSRKGLTTR